MSSGHGKLKRIDKHPHYYVDGASGRIYFIKRISGAVVKISTKTKGINEAKKYVDDELIRRFSSNPGKEKRRRAGITNPKLSDLWKEVIENRGVRAEATFKSYHTAWKNGIEPFWGDKRASDVNRSTVVLYEKWYLKKHSTRTFFNTRKGLLMLFNYMEQNDYLSEVPIVEDLDPVILKKSKKTPVGRVYTDAETKSLLASSLDKHRLAIMMGRFLGMRKMEILSAKWENVIFKDRFMKVWSSKNKKWREIPLPGNVLELLTLIKSQSKGEEHIFPMARDKTRHISGQYFDKAWLKAKEKAGIVGWDIPHASRFHDLRHTFATQTARENWPPMVACKILDMSLHEYERTYVHVTKHDARKLMDRSFE